MLNMNNICRLYGTQERYLCESHIVPNFVIRRIKQTGSEYLRQLAYPNKRLQDGPKIKLLGQRAENLFSVNEKQFKQQIFDPYLTNPDQVLTYDQHLYWFALSFLWRVVVIHLEHTPEFKNHWTEDHLKIVENEWRESLITNQHPPKYHELQIMLTQRVGKVNFPTKGFDYYLTRSIDLSIVTSDDKTYIAVYGKFMRFIFWSVISPLLKYSGPSTIINPMGGKTSLLTELPDAYLFKFLRNRPNEINLLPQISSQQLAAIHKQVTKEGEAFLNSDAYQAIKNDLENLDNI